MLTQTGLSLTGVMHPSPMSQTVYVAPPYRLTSAGHDGLPQSGGLGCTSAGAYRFAWNVVLEELRVDNTPFRAQPKTELIYKPMTLVVGY